MPIQIRVSESAYQEKLITINRQKMFITLSFNTRDNRWYIDLVDRNKDDIISGVKITPNKNLTGKYVDVHNLLGGDLVCVDTKVSGKDIEKDTFGTDKQFQLLYISNEEQEELANGTAV